MKWDDVDCEEMSMFVVVFVDDGHGPVFAILSRRGLGGSSPSREVHVVHENDTRAMFV